MFTKLFPYFFEISKNLKPPNAVTEKKKKDKKTDLHVPKTKNVFHRRENI